MDFGFPWSIKVLAFLQFNNIKSYVCWSVKQTRRTANVTWAANEANLRLVLHV